MKTFWTVFVFSFLGAWAWTASAPRVPVRTPPTPQGLIEQPLPSKKAQKARLLREAAEAMEDEARRDLEQLGTTISNRLSLMEFSSDRFIVRTRGVSFMEVGTGLVMQVRFDYAEK